MRRSATFLLVLLAVAQPARAHLMPAKQGTLNLLGPSVFAVLSVPVTALHGFDDDGDGLLSLQELDRHQEALRAEIDHRFRLFDGSTEGRTVRVDLVLSPEHETAQDRSSQVIMLKHTQFEGVPKELRLTCDLFGTRDAERQLTVTATRHPASGPAEVEPAILTPLSPAHRFFRPLPAALLDTVRTGAEHVLFGTDHLLFLLTIIVAGVGWRYWLSIDTGFTVAHSLTLGAVMLGYVQLPSRVVEPLIAASIVLVAVDNLVRRTPSLRQRVGIVCACGLLHGLGFATSLDALGLDSRHRFWGLLSFNLGIEVGQALFLGAVLLVLLAGRRVLPRLDGVLTTRLVSVFAAVIGAAWLVQRLAQ